MFQRLSFRMKELMVKARFVGDKLFNVGGPFPDKRKRTLGRS